MASKDISACLSSKSVHWATPQVLYDAFINSGYIDPCPLHSLEDGLQKNYLHEKLFINPPFNELDKWCDYAIKQFLNGCKVVLLMPSRTDTKYFHKIISYEPTIYFFDSRLRFNESKGTAPFPTLLVVLEPFCFIPLYRSCNTETLIKELKLYGKQCSN